MENMFREFMEVMNERFHKVKPVREGIKATNDFCILDEEQQQRTSCISP